MTKKHKPMNDEERDLVQRLLDTTIEIKSMGFSMPPDVEARIEEMKGWLETGEMVVDIPDLDGPLAEAFTPPDEDS